MKELPVRKNIRLKGYDYSREGKYFITICVKDRYELLGEIVVEDAHLGGSTVKLTETGEMVKQYIDKIPTVYSTFKMTKYVIMPNHIHMIVVIWSGMPGSASPTKSVLAKMVNAFKSLTSREFGESMWQRSYHDHIIHGEAEYQKIWRYIEENPAKWKEDCYYRL